MDLPKIIQGLSGDKAKLERVIASLEDLQRNAVQVPQFPEAGKKGRTSMPAEERRQVSARMKRYWERYREERKAGKPA